jgi:hypothetical protein
MLTALRRARAPRAARKQLFLSHAWKPDGLGRDTHARARQLKDSLERVGWSVWFDEKDMKLNLDASMILGIETASVVLVCLTREYCRQINDSCFDPRKRSNCYKEWKYAHARHKIVLGVVFEPGIVSGTWPPGVLTMYICDQLYINAIGDDLATVAYDISRMLFNFGIYPCAEDSSDTHPPRRARTPRRAVVNV